MTTILGSCVAVCLHDPVAGIGGLNHFLLPHSSHDAETSPRYAAPAVDSLVGAMLREGARPSRLQACIIGGARVLSAFAGMLVPGGYLGIADLEREDGSFHGADFDGHHGFERPAMRSEIIMPASVPCVIPWPESPVATNTLS